MTRGLAPQRLKRKYIQGLCSPPKATPSQNPYATPHERDQHAPSIPARLSPSEERNMTPNPHIVDEMKHCPDKIAAKYVSI